MLPILISVTILCVSSFVTQNKISHYNFNLNARPFENRNVPKLKFEKLRYPKLNFTDDAITWYIAAYGEEKYLKNYKDYHI